MPDSDSGFGKFVPGFDFLQSLAKGASQSIPQMPNLANWVAPSLNPEELEKRISELKAVHFWLEQNSRALGATIQALEVQKLTLATLKGMNFHVGDVANAFKLKAADSLSRGVQQFNDTFAASNPPAAEPEAPDAPEAEPDPEPAAPARKTGAGKAARTAKAASAPAMVDPMQLWGALTQQFQQIAATALKDVGKATAVDMGKNIATGLAKGALKAATGAPRKAASAKLPRARKPSPAKATTAKRRT